MITPAPLPAADRARGDGPSSSTPCGPATSWGIGDLGDLRALAGVVAPGSGAGVMLINPLHAAAPGGPRSRARTRRPSRLWRNITYLAVADVPGAGALGAELAALDDAGRAAQRPPRIDRDAVHRLKMDALTRLHAAFEAGAGPPSTSTTGGWRRGRPCAASPRGARWPSGTGRPTPAWPDEVPPSRVAGRRDVCRRRAGPDPLPRMVPVAARRPTGRGGPRRRAARGRPRRRLRPQRRRRVGVPGPARPGLPGRRPARHVQPGRPGLGPAPVRALEAARRRATSRSSPPCGRTWRHVVACASTT